VSRSIEPNLAEQNWQSGWEDSTAPGVSGLVEAGGAFTGGLCSIVN